MFPHWLFVSYFNRNQENVWLAFKKRCVALTGVLLVEVTKQYSALFDKYDLVLRLV